MRLAFHEINTVKKNIQFIAEYGRYDDLLVLMDTPCESAMLNCLQKQLQQDIASMEANQDVSLLGKWLPSINTSNAKAVMYAKRIAKAFGMTEAAYRKLLTSLRARIRIIENNLRKKDYTFDYEKQPSRALLKYHKAFLRNDKTRYKSFLSAVESGEKKLHADHVAPYELVAPYLDVHRTNGCFMKRISLEEKATLNATWASLPDFGNSENALAVIDTSGSMYFGGEPLPASVALSLGLYFAEHNKGTFRNHFIEFSAKPQLIEIKGETFADRLRYVATFNEVGNTNLEAVFDLILNAAVKHHVPQDELPTKLIIISDMEFDMCVQDASAINFQNAQQKFISNGYVLPLIIFWNVANRNHQQPVTQNDQGVILISGAEPRVFSMVADGSVSPYAFMMSILNSERYASIGA